MIKKIIRGKCERVKKKKRGGEDTEELSEDQTGKNR